MMRTITDANGSQWQVSMSGRRTPYVRDELSLEYRRVGSDERRYVRFRPAAAAAPELAFNATSDAILTRLLTSSQPAWTSPEGVRRPA